MPRLARKDLSTSFFHVIVQGIKKEYIFEKDTYINKYLQLLNQYKDKFNIDILAYCIMNNHAHILLYIKDVKEMSMFMHRINSIYAKYYNGVKDKRVGYVFRNRYISEPIYNEKYLINCIKYIHLNPVKANMVKNCEEYPYSSYSQLVEKKQGRGYEILTQIFGDEIQEMLKDNYEEEYIFFDIDIDKNDKINKVIKMFEIETGKSRGEIREDERLLLELVYKLKKDHKIHYKDIIKTINISKSKMYRIRSKIGGIKEQTF